MNKEILRKYLNNSCTDQEFEELARWIKSEASKKEGKKWGLDQWKSFDPGNESQNRKQYNALLDRIHHEINLKQQTNKNNRTIALNHVTSWITRAAAILFIPLLGMVLYVLTNNNLQWEKRTSMAIDTLEIIAPICSRTVLILSDGTKVNLNYGSRIKYPRSFNGNTREISLWGEGYFDVSHNPDKPFIVKTDNLNIKALGTEFNVNAYPGDDVIATTLVEGQVVIEKRLPDKTNQFIKKMTPGQHIAYHLSSDLFILSTNRTNQYIGWKDGKLIFDNEPITGVAKRLGRMFNVDIEIAESVKDLTYTVTFVNEPLFLILDLMTETTPVVYKRYPRKKLPNGTYARQKILISKRP